MGHKLPALSLAQIVEKSRWRGDMVIAAVQTEYADVGYRSVGNDHEDVTAHRPAAAVAAGDILHLEGGQVAVMAVVADAAVELRPAVLLPSLSPPPPLLLSPLLQLRNVVHG